mmetsp:Transcript_24708/g.48468  ORF Transcript_24708/g.48468 Transcript_24708/m.48468 type:complete len:192 (+) Transcript_24708:228-803(+)
MERFIQIVSCLFRKKKDSKSPGQISAKLGGGRKPVKKEDPKAPKGKNSTSGGVQADHSPQKKKKNKNEVKGTPKRKTTKKSADQKAKGSGHRVNRVSQRPSTPPPCHWLPWDKPGEEDSLSSKEAVRTEGRLSPPRSLLPAKTVRASVSPPRHWLPWDERHDLSGERAVGEGLYSKKVGSHSSGRHPRKTV